MRIQRGWFYLADLSPRRGTEPGKTRPVLVLQTDLLNSTGHPSTIILPLTSNVKDNAEPLRVRISAGSPGFETDSDIMIDQIRATDNRRFCRYNSDQLIKRITQADVSLLLRVEQNLRKILDFSQ